MLHDPLHQVAQKALDEFPHADLLAAWPAKLRHSLQKMAGLSAFVMAQLQKDPELTRRLPEYLTRILSLDEHRERLNQALAHLTDEAQGMRVLRNYRNHALTVIAWRDFLSLWPVEQSLSQLSELAEAIILEAYHWQYHLCCQDFGTPCNRRNEPQPLLIIGMGKLGGGELNFSSDIDLIFTYPEEGETQGSRRSIANSQFFTRLGQRLIKVLSAPTLDGFCYRVDMRLRPFGDSGPLVMSFDALEAYYQEQGRDWERYAMIKARVMGKDSLPHYQPLHDMLRPFVFRRYIDFSAIDSLRRMKAMITSEIRRGNLKDNIKLGQGGIREIEFIAQVFQLIRGGKEPSLRNRGLLKTLVAIEDLALLSSQQVAQLRQSYLYLRKLENLLQAMEDKQTQTLPQDPTALLQLACAMGFDSGEQLLSATDRQMTQVHLIFTDLIGEHSDEKEKAIADFFFELWNMIDNEPVIKQIVTQELPTFDAENICYSLHRFWQDLEKKTLGARGQSVLNRLMPRVLASVFSHPNGEFGLERVLKVLSNIVTRTTYLELLEQYPDALNQLVHLCIESIMISDQLSQYPMLLDELIDPNRLYHPIELNAYAIELGEFLARIPADDDEQQMNALRQFKQICTLKIAAADLSGVLTVMQVSDHLTTLAQTLIAGVIELAWRQITHKYGSPSHLTNTENKGLAVIAYGKLGGIELGYHSDLDLVFVDNCPSHSVTTGEKSIDSRRFYLKLSQRVLHIFSVRTADGCLYEVDMRLRPSGNSGLLIVPIASFASYQFDQAWTWEHQALVRARVVFGDQDLQAEFAQIRAKTLSLHRDPKKLKNDVSQMRKKMRQALAHKKEGRFMIKEDAGGITDIEFLAQYWVLLFSHQHPELTQSSDTISIFETLCAQAIIDRTTADALINAYTKMRHLVHHKNLLNLPPHVKENKMGSERQAVRKIWGEWLE